MLERVVAVVAVLYPCVVVALSWLLLIVVVVVVVVTMCRVL